ncbi:hypothetical protein IPZ58_29930 [Streptomyces roseoverticillatus]|uniref:hypothetical protein n=1 Tax=Streptomyces roseoverticillatus TaxID=66429 RepID=UPI001F21C4EA|nr:hypothetical protein [Streptomyces roseoverticillatus]MCF3105775.1 hypothetical protein [Streptomyces roseoverticillatus]
MTTAPVTPGRPRSLGKGVQALIPPETGSPADQAAALIAAVQDVQMPAALVQAAALILEAASRPEPMDEACRERAADLAMLFARALDRDV